MLAARTLQTMRVTRNENVEVFFPRVVKILGHRGNPRRYADNHLSGIREAMIAADGAEIDVRRCASGELVLSHDPQIAGAIVSDTDLRGLRRLDPDLATLDELLADLPDGMLDLEVKNSPAEPGFEADHGIALEVASMARPQDVVTCFFWPSVDEIARRMPAVATGLLFTLGTIGDAVRHAVDLGHEMICPHHELIGSASDLGLADDASIAVAAWTVNERERVSELAAWGIDTIITDRPTEAVAWTGGSTT